MADPAINSDPIPSPEPGAPFSFMLMLPTLVVDVAMPIVTFNVLTHYRVSTLWALAAGGLFPALNNLRVWITARKLEPLGIIVMTFLVIGTAASLASGSVFFMLIKESVLTAAFGLLCLGSLLAERPLLFYINRQFVAGDDPVKLDWWNGLWQYPGFRAAQRTVTAVWGVAYLAEAALRVVFALIMSPSEVVTISPIMAFGVTIALIIWTRRYMLAQRDRRLRENQLAPST